MILDTPLRLDAQAQWLTDVRQVLSPNQDDRPENSGISLLVIHAISLPPGEFGGGHIDQLFTNCLDPAVHPYFAEVADHKVSAHILVNRHGELTQYVPFNKRAWHAGVSVFKGRPRCNDFSIGVELEGCDDQPYTGEQYSKLVELTRVLMIQWPAIVRDNIVGHCQIAPDRKTDPGPRFDWNNYFALLEQHD